MGIPEKVDGDFGAWGDLTGGYFGLGVFEVRSGVVRGDLEVLISVSTGLAWVLMGVTLL